MTMTINETEIRKTIELLKPNNSLFEVRAIDNKWNASGYFTNADTLINALKTTYFKPNSNFYITLNSIKLDCYSRSQHDNFIEYAKPTTGDSDILNYEFLMVDLDPKRASGTSASSEQLDYAKKKARQVYAFLKSRGWNEPVVSMSGNGVHLLYAIGLGNTPENAALIKNCLLALDMIFSDGMIDIDMTTFNPSRITKLYGTVARKGANTADRPHRLSHIVMGKDAQQNDKKLLLELCELLPKEEKPEKYNNYNPKSFDLEEWISKAGLRVSGRSKWNGGTKWILEECPFDSSHTGKDAAIIQAPDGKICFNCFHNSCACNKWRELRLKFEPDAYDKKYVDNKTYPNYQNPDYKAVTVSETVIIDGKPVFYTTEQIRLMKTPPEEFIKTGITVIDRKMRGLKKGFVTCMSGLRASGKSSIISQFTNEAVDQGYKVAMFSGELTAKNTYNWLILQGAGKDNVSATQYENFYQVHAEKEEIISKWLDNKVFIYNNDYGNNFAELKGRLNKCVVEHKVDLIILDNLMSLNISMLDRDRYQQQSKFVDELEIFAKQANIHIIFIAHPRKSNGFLRLDDVSGSNDIVNRVDNAFVLHRVNNDFKRLSKDMFEWSEDSELYQCSNVIEICKDRNNGVQDEFIPLYFEKSCKRLKNTEYENKVYGWEKTVSYNNDFFEYVEVSDVENPFLQDTQ